MRIFTQTAILILCFLMVAMAGGVTTLQFFFTVKKIFPSADHVHILISKKAFNEQKTKIVRSANQVQLKTTIYEIESMSDIGSKINQIPDHAIVIVYSNPILMNKKSRLFILKKSTDKQLSLVTDSEAYTRAGALVGLLPAEDDRTKLVVNLTHNKNIAGRFTPEFIQKMGIAQVIRE